MPPSATPVDVDLKAEWKLQFDDLNVQMAGQDELLAAFRTKSPDGDFEKQVYRRQSLFLPTDRDPVDAVVRRTEAALSEIQRLGPTADLTAVGRALKGLKARIAGTDPSRAKERYDLFVEVCQLRRKIVLANPLLDFSSIVFITRAGAPGHCCDQYFGFKNGGGGGLYVLEDAFTDRPRIRDLLAGAAVSAGRLKGEKLVGGAFLSPALSYDGKTVLFAYAERRRGAKPWSPESSFHIFGIGADGSGLTQLTDGTWNEFDPWFLPNGRVVFISERRGGFGRCHGRPVPTYTLHSMDPGGGDIVCLSYHETNEWNPSVTHDGMILYSRWDYVDRGAEITHHPWLTTPDGRDARAIHGNYPVSTRRRPYMEAHVRAIPASDKLIATACAHHGESQGSLVLLDASIEDDDVMSQVLRITPQTLFPESEGRSRGGEGTFATAWPLSEDFYLAVYLPRPGPNQRPTRHGIYLLDSFGNRELLYRDEKLRCWNPVPLRPRPAPPVVSHRTAVGAARRVARGGGEPAGGPSAGSAPEGVVAVMNVYDGLKPWPEGTRIKALRVIQLFPKATPNVNKPNISRRSQALARGVLGEVAVEEDGSAHFVLPAGKAVYFQVLDERGLAVQSMMSATYVHPGERLICQGCHDRRARAPQRAGGVALALRRPPSRLSADVDGAMPASFPRLVQPVLDRKCLPCHSRREKAPSLSRELGERYGWSQAYETLSRRAWSGGGTRSTPGRVGARASSLLRMLDAGHNDVKLSAEELRRITLWLDCGSPFFGAYLHPDRQARGERIMPAVQ